MDTQTNKMSPYPDIMRRKIASCMPVTILSYMQARI